MTFDQLKFRSDPVMTFCKETDQKQKIKLLVKACPHLKYNARSYAAEYWEIEPDRCSQDFIEKYLLEIHNYDCIDVSRIISECKNATTTNS